MGEITTSTHPQWTYTHVRDRRLQTLLARLRIGHTYLTQRYLMTREPQPYCDDCLVSLTVRHLLVECPSLIELRSRLVKQMADTQENIRLGDVRELAARCGRLLWCGWRRALNRGRRGRATIAGVGWLARFSVAR
ncbi:hypothetical protein E2C01_049652 [Portunus trituberculatus]|uniref:Uncharacterized protein n=1 Tax=Portunus trituberculatus TaxID=210409 RepID=A0A5B7GEX5_PORTR|nr:hypothetical protein [Portunus trituberculatus]